MNPQLSLIDPSSEHSCNLFFALFPDAQAAAEICLLANTFREQHGLKGKVPEAGLFHVSLCHVGTYDGDIPESILTQARRAASSIVLPAFDVTFDYARRFSRDQRKTVALVANEGNAELRALQQTLGKALKRAGLGRWVATAYLPHITLFHDAPDNSADHIARVSWTAREFVLVRSLVGESHYDRLEAWPLQAPGLS